MKVLLELQDQPSNIRRITVRHDIVVGRGSDCNLRLSAPQVSRRHCFLRVGRDIASVTDLDSSNGTFVDGIRIQAGKRCELRDGQMLSVGPIRFLVKVQSEVVAAEILSGLSLSDSVSTHPHRGSPSGATVIESAAGLVPAMPKPDSADHSLHGHIFSVEHAGDSSESHEATADFNASRGNVPPAGLHAHDGELFDDLEIVDDADIIDEVEVIEDVEVIDDAEVIEAVEVVDDVEVLDDSSFADEPEVIDELPNLDRVSDDSKSNWFLDDDPDQKSV